MKTDESRRIPIEAGQLAALLLSAMILAAAVVHAQTFRGAIVGTVIDQSQAPAPDVKVTAKNQATGLTRTASTDTSGNYDIPELPLGDYTVTLEKEGFETVTQADVRVDVAAERLKGPKPRTCLSTGATIPSSSIWCRELPGLLTRLPTRPAPSEFSLSTGRVAARTTFCSTART